MKKDYRERVNLETTMNLPANPLCRTNLNKVKDLMSEELGFSVTHNQVIQKLLADYIKLHEKDAA